MSAEIITEYYSNGQKKSEGLWDEYQLIGEHITWYEGGNKESESFVLNMDDSIYMSTYWYESGQIECKGARIADMYETGLWTYWYENGNKSSEGFFENRGPNGEWNYWHSNGQLACTGVHKGWNGDGLWVFWDKEGNKVHEREYVELELLGVWDNLKADGCSDELINQYKKFIGWMDVWHSVHKKA
jgi:antitoxin component YwqK of YwqJK toxin-antitoxin module